MKRALSLVLALSMIICLLPALALSSTADDQTENTAIDETVPGLTLTSYQLISVGSLYGNAYKRVMGEPTWGYNSSYTNNLTFDGTIDDLVYWSKLLGHEDGLTDFSKFNGDYAKSFGAVNDEYYMLHWTGTATVASDVTFTMVGNAMDNGFVFFIGENEDSLEKAYEYWGANYYFNNENDKLVSVYGEKSFEAGVTYAVDAWFLEIDHGEALDFGGYLHDSTEYKSLADLGFSFDLSVDCYRTEVDNWSENNNYDNPYTKVFKDALGDNYKGTGSDGEYRGGNGGQCIPANMNYDATIEGLLAASRKAGSGVVVPTIDTHTLVIADESYINLYDGTFTVAQTGYYWFGCIDVDNGLMIDIIDGENTTRAFEFWALATWQDDGSETWYTDSVYLEAGKTYGIHAAYMEQNGGQVVRPAVKFSETENFDGVNSAAIESVLAFRTTIPEGSDRLSAAKAEALYNSDFSVSGKVTNARTNKGTWGDGAAENAFDGNINTKFGSSSDGAIADTIYWRTTEPTIITYYGFVTAADNADYVRTPIKWALYGSNDGVAYTLIDNVNRGDGGLGWFSSALAVYEVDLPEEYSFYRIDIVSNWDGDIDHGAVSFAEILLYNAPKAYVTAESDSVENGKTIEFTVSIKGARTFNALSIEPLYDDSIFELVSGEWIQDGAALYDFDMIGGVGVVAWRQMTDVGDSVFKFVLKAIAETDETSIGANLQYQAIGDTGVQIVNIEAEPAVIAVKPAHVHDYTISYVWADDYSTCTATAHCEGCGDEIEETVDSEYSVTEPNCDTSGTGTYTAEFENELFETQTHNVELDPNGHTLTHHDRNEPTHFAPGNIEYWTCDVCHKFFSDGEGGNEIEESDTVLAQIEHTFSDEWSKDETNHWHECECGAKTDEAAHTFGDWEVTKEASVSEAGERKHACTVCGYEESEPIDKKEPITEYDKTTEEGDSDEGVLTPEDWNNVIEAVTAGGAGTRITILLDDGTVVLTPEQIEAIAEARDGDDSSVEIVLMKIGVDYDKLTAAQKDTLGRVDGKMDAYVLIVSIIDGEGGKTPVDLGDEKVSVTVGFTPDDGKFVSVYTIADDGKETETEAVSENGDVTFDATTGTVYLVTDGVINPPETGDFATVAAIIVILAAITLGVAVVVTAKRKKIGE